MAVDMKGHSRKSEAPVQNNEYGSQNAYAALIYKTTLTYFCWRKSLGDERVLA
jgi:hypothetical protein